MSIIPQSQERTSLHIYLKVSLRENAIKNFPNAANLVLDLGFLHPNQTIRYSISDTFKLDDNDNKNGKKCSSAEPLTSGLGELVPLPDPGRSSSSGQALGS